MSISTWKALFACVCLIAGVSSCKKDDPSTLFPPPPPDQSFTEEFDTTTAAYDRGWRYINVSNPKHDGWWTQGGFHNPTMWGGIYYASNGVLPKPIPFNPYSSKGTYAGFVAAYFNSINAIEVLSSDTSGIISTWLVSPAVIVKNGDKISFYTRSMLVPGNGVSGGDSIDYGVRLQVRLNTSASLNVGSGADPGEFTTLLHDFNPEYAFFHTDPANANPDAYPGTWTQMQVTVTGVPEPRSARFAFRFFNDRWGEFDPFGNVVTASTGLAIDQVQFVSAP